MSGFAVLVVAIAIVSAIIGAGATAIAWRGRRGAGLRPPLYSDALPLPFAYLDTDLTYRIVNRAYEDLLALPAAELIGRRIDDGTGPLSHPDLLAAAGSAAGGHPARLETGTAIRSAPRPLGVTFTPDRDEAGEVRGVAVVVEDLAERRNAEERLRGSEATTRAILDAAVDGILTIDAEGCIQSFNRAAERIFGYRAEEVVGRNVAILMPEPYRGEHDRYMRNYLTTGQARIIGIGREVAGQRKDGSVFPMDLAVGESRVGGRRIFAGIVRDISERKLAEEQLRHSEERFRLLVDGVQDYAIEMLDTEGKVASWNPGTERIAGWTADEVLGRHFSCFFPPEAVAAGEPERALRTAREQGRFQAEGWRVRKDGSRYWSHVVLAPLTGDDGKLRGFVRIARDITERKQTEDALRRAKEDAEAAREEAERANLAKSKFLAAASHDLRQPVQALFFFTTALARKLEGHPAREILADLERSLEALNLLLDALLDISRLDAGVVQPNDTTFSVGSLLDRIEAEFGPQARHKKLELRVVPSTAMIRGDPALLSRVLSNLTANAVRYTRRGRILIGCRRRAGALRIEVTDTGIGIPADKLKDVFQEFYQISNPERDRSQGLGLGLAIVDRLSKLMGHPIEVRSQEGKGSTFAIEVPLGESPAAAAAAARRVAAERKLGLIVIIDDEPTVLKGLLMILQEWGFEVIAATSEEEAMRLLGDLQKQPNAIVADYRLRNGRTGTEAIQHIRALFNQPIPSIIITGDTAPERLREAEASGLSILHKPVQPRQLHDLLSGTLNGG